MTAIRALPLIAFVVTLAVFWQASAYQYLNYDDPGYVLNNVHVLNGLTWSGITAAFDSVIMFNWHPLTILSLALDVELFGLSPRAAHTTSILWHGLNAALVCIALTGLTSKPWRAFAVALLFAVHPFRIESVAWISERKDVLSAAFFLATLIAYQRYSRQGDGRWRAYAVALIAFALALLAKPMVVTLPGVILLLDVWPLARIDLASPARWRVGARLITEKLPFSDWRQLPA